MTNDIETTHVQIPGTMSARVAHGRIIGFDFSPAAAYAGYFLPGTNVVEGDEITSDEFFDLVPDTLTVTQDKKSSFFSAEWVC